LIGTNIDTAAVATVRIAKLLDELPFLKERSTRR